MYRGEKDLDIERLNKIGDRPGLYRNFSYRILVVRRIDDDARARRNGLELGLYFEAGHTWHPYIDDSESHRTADSVRQKLQWLSKQVRF